MTFKFYDTCSLLLRASNLFDDPEERIVISTISLKEMENIKTAYNKDATTKYAARTILHQLDENSDKYDVVIYQESFINPITQLDYLINDDMKILGCAIAYQKQNPDMVFVTNDLSLKTIAHNFFNKIESIEIEPDTYDGFQEVIMTDEELANFYCNLQHNQFNSYINEYLIIRNQNNDIVDSMKWDGIEYKHLSYANFDSRWFGHIKPMSGDIYQALYADSLTNNQITMVKGPAGSGKTFLALSFLFYKMEKGEIDKIIVFCNTVATRNSAKLGYYPGTRDEKLLDSQIGNLLSSKLGDKTYVEELIANGKIVLLPLSDIRGYDTSGMHAGVYISEAQNMDIDSMKLVLQRIGEDSICIIDGDFKAQVDLIEYAGANNGMRKASKVFRGHDIYGEVTLKDIHRSKIAEIAEAM